MSLKQIHYTTMLTIIMVFILHGDKYKSTTLLNSRVSHCGAREFVGIIIMTIVSLCKGEPTINVSIWVSLPIFLGTMCRIEYDIKSDHC